MINSLKKLFDGAMRGSGFMKAVTTLLSGTVLALIISYVAQPILTRLYTPEAFGLFDTFISLVALLLPFASLRYEDAIMLPEDDEEALGVMGLSFFLVVALALVTSGISFFETPLLNRFDQANLTGCLVWIPLTLVAVRFAKLTELWLNRKKQYAAISAGQVAQTGLMAGSRIALSKVTATTLPFGLIWGYIAGHVASATWYSTQILRTQSAFSKHFFDWHNIKRAAIRFKRFPRFSMPSTVLTSLQSRLPFLLLLVFFDETTVGYFGRAFALFAVPLSLMGHAISQVFFVEGAIARREGTLANLTAKVHSRLVTIGLFPTLAIMITGPQVMGFFLGAAWEPAGVYLQWLAPWFFLSSVASPLTRIFDILEKQRLDLLTSITIFMVQTSLFIFGCLTGDLITALLYLSAGGFLARIIHIIVLLKLSGTPLKASIYPYLQQTLISTPFLVALYFVQRIETPWLTSVALAAAGLVFLMIVYRQLMR